MRATASSETANWWLILYPFTLVFLVEAPHSSSKSCWSVRSSKPGWYYWGAMVKITKDSQPGKGLKAKSLKAKSLRQRAQNWKGMTVTQLLKLWAMLKASSKMMLWYQFIEFHLSADLTATRQFKRGIQSRFKKKKDFHYKLGSTDF